MWTEISSKELFFECSVKRGLFLVQATQFITCTRAQCGGEPAVWPQKICSVCTHTKKRPLLTLHSQAFTLKRDLINRVSFDYTQNQVITLKATSSILLLITLFHTLRTQTRCDDELLSWGSFQRCGKKNSFLKKKIMTNCFPGALFRGVFPFLVLFSEMHFWF